MDVDPSILGYYSQGLERGRLFDEAHGVLERLRTWDILDRRLPSEGIALDVGGGAGVHAAWMASRGLAGGVVRPDRTARRPGVCDGGESSGG